MLFASHCGMFLRDHLREVGERCRQFFFFESEENLEALAFLVGLTHDFGKYTTYFQDRLLGKKDWGKLSDHGFLSALYTAFAVERSAESFRMGEMEKFLPLVAFFVVFHHHLDLRSLGYVGERLEEGSESWVVIEKQITNLREHAEDISGELEALGLPPLSAFFEDLEPLRMRLRKAKYHFENHLTEERQAQIAILVLSLFSALVDADKKSAGKIEMIERRVLPASLVETYKEQHLGNQKNSGPIDVLREEIFVQVVTRVPSIDLRRHHLFTLTAPTGSGKTLTSFAFALKLRERIEKEWGYSPRIIYALPFISIIDQNFAILSQVLAQIEDFQENHSAYLLGHHHLSELRYEEGGEEKEIDMALSLIESWESEVIVTTFVQLFHSVVGFKNRLLRKYHNLARSIIILDEVQNVPGEYWSLLRRVFLLLARYLGCFIILVTATKPFIFEEGEAIELLPEGKRYFRTFSRVVLRPRLAKPQTVEEFVRWFGDSYDASRSYLIVLNTIRSSLTTYEGLKRLGIANLYYLSANLISLDKLNRIWEVKMALEKGQKPVLVSTQVVEAGVDLDFDCAIRDIGPLDSIIQVAGRCNRNFRNDRNTGETFVVLLEDESQRRFASYVYLKMLPAVTLELLGNVESIQEREFLEILENYFVRVKNWKSTSESDEVYQALLSLRFHEERETSVSHFQLIREEGTILPVFVEKDRRAQEIWECFSEIKRSSSLKLWEKSIALRRIQKDFGDYLVNVRIRKNDVPLLGILASPHLGYVPQSRVAEFYHPETGFRRDFQDSEALFL